MNYSIYNSYFLKIGVFLFLASKTLAAGHAVSVTKPQSVSRPVQLTVIADVSSFPNSKITMGSDRSYRLTAQIASGMVFNLVPGSSVLATLPTIHNRNVLTKVSSISKTKIELLLNNQVQLLDGQRLRITLPIKPIHLYRIPFQAIYSPRGLTTEVFTVSANQRAHLVSVTPLQFLPDGNVIVYSDQLANTIIVVHGTDNLIHGDSVQVIEPTQHKEPQL